MDTEKIPKTELEYWISIKALSALSRNLKKDLRYYTDIDDPNMKNDQVTIDRCNETKNELVDRLCEKFAVIRPNDTPKSKRGVGLPVPPEGKRYYRDWHRSMRERFVTERYESIICSACPFGTNIEMMILFDLSPCRLAGPMLPSPAPRLCGMTASGRMSEKGLRKRILEAAGEEALSVFRKKFESLSVHPS